jgi:hypothetical protein
MFRRVYLPMLSAGLLLSLSLIASAQTAKHDALWLKVVEHNSLMKNWAAKEIETDLKSENSDKVIKTIKMKKQFSEWVKNQAQYEVVSVEPPPNNKEGSKKIPDMMEVFASMESEIFSKDAQVKRSNDQLLDGKQSVLFETEASGAKMKLWIDPITSQWLKREIDLSVMFTLEGQIKTMYQSTQNGFSLPSSAEVKMNILIPFKKAKIEMRDIYRNWFSRT